MKKYLFILLIILCPVLIFSQNVGIGTDNSSEKLEVDGNLKVAGIISGVSDPVSAQDAATKAYVDLLEAQILELQLIAGVKVQDIDGNIYSTVKIGEQRWLAENLNVGAMIAGSGDQADNAIIEKYCYNNNTANCDIYGDSTSGTR